MLELNYLILWATMVITGIAGNTKLNWYFNSVSLLIFTLVSMIAAFTLGIGAYDITIYSGGSTILTNDNSIGYFFTGWGLLMLIRFITIAFISFTAIIKD